MSAIFVCALVGIGCGASNTPEERGVGLQANDAAEDSTDLSNQDSATIDSTSEDSSAAPTDSTTAETSSMGDASIDDSSTDDSSTGDSLVSESASDSPADTCTCPTPDPSLHELATCTGGVCGVACAPGWKQCTGGTVKGCQTDVFTDTFNCGDCKIKCPWDKPFCKMGVCSP